MRAIAERGLLEITIQRLADLAADPLDDVEGVGSRDIFGQRAHGAPEQAGRMRHGNTNTYGTRLHEIHNQRPPQAMDRPVIDCVRFWTKAYARGPCGLVQGCDSVEASLPLAASRLPKLRFPTYNINC